MIFRILDQGKKQEFNESDFPLAVKILSSGGFGFASGADADSIATFEFLDTQLFMRVQQDAELIFINGKVLEDSKRLNTGDEIQINESKFIVKAETGLVELTGVQKPKEPEVEPEEPPVIAALPAKKMHPGLRNAIITGFVFLLLGVIYVLSAASVRITVTPDPKSLSLSGFPPVIKIADGYLALPGQYKVNAQREGYRDLQETVRVTLGSDASYEYKFQKLPGLLDIVSIPVEGAKVELDGKVIGMTPMRLFEIEAGSHQLTFTAPRFSTIVRTVDIEGAGKRQALEVALEPDWGTLKVESQPQGAEVLLNGERLGITPLITEPIAGEYQIKLNKEGWRPITDNVTVESGKINDVLLYTLQKVDGTVEVTSKPEGARVSLNGMFEGNTPITLKMESEKEHQLSISKNGFITAEQTLRVQKDEVQNINIALEPEYGTVFIMSRPAGAALSIDGNVMEGPATRRLRLITLPHTIEISKAGYQTFTTTLTPTRGAIQKN